MLCSWPLTYKLLTIVCMCLHDMCLCAHLYLNIVSLKLPWITAGRLSHMCVYVHNTVQVNYPSWSLHVITMRLLAFNVNSSTLSWLNAGMASQILLHIWWIMPSVQLMPRIMMKRLDFTWPASKYKCSMFTFWLAIVGGNQTWKKIYFGR